MKELINAVDNLPWIVKILLCLPVVAIVWSVYRLIKSISVGNVLGIVLSIVLLVAGPSFFWIFDLICVILNKKIWWFC
ncbi:MAG: hypothetical protein E7596_04285 [Ruminococcaceae bacterium]|nr:hypothetical protein [Oscillospiraceae bacterium]